MYILIAVPEFIAIGMIVGICLGVVALVITITIVVIFLRRRHAKDPHMYVLS